MKIVLCGPPHCFNAPKGWYLFLTASSGGIITLFFINPAVLGVNCHSERNTFSQNPHVARNFTQPCPHRWRYVLMQTASCGFDGVNFPSDRWKGIPPLSPGIVIFFKNTRQKVVIGSVFLSAREIAFNAFLCEGYGWGQAPALQKDIPQGVMDLSKLTRVVGRMQCRSLWLHA